MWKRGRKQDSVSLTHHPHSLYSSAVCDCGSSGPAVWPCAACSSPQAFDPEAVFFEPVYVLVTHHNLAFEILSAPCPYSCSTNYTAKPHSQLRWTLHTACLQLNSWIGLEIKRLSRHGGKQENEVCSQEKKQLIETNPEMTQMLPSAKIS